jgi:prepilin-type N-terminal cleavage/methylation domain-containing protein
MRQKSEVRNQDGVGSSSAPTPSRSLRRRRGGFTLIEMLVVVLIMALLMGLLVRHMSNADDRANRAATTKTIEQVSAALEEFFAEYGQYPPVPVYAGDGWQPIYFEFPVEYLPPDPRAGPPDLSGTQYIGALNPFSDPTLDQRLFTLGLVSFLVPRYGTVIANSPWFGANPDAFKDPNAQWNFHTPSQIDQPRDLAAIARWAPFLEGVIQPSPGMTHSNALLGRTWINQGFTIRDAWGDALRYESVPPHQSYRLWSGNSKMND